MLKAVLLVLLIAFSSARRGVNIASRSVTRSEAKCLGENFELTALDFMDASGNVNTRFFDSYIYLLDGGVKELNAIIRVNDSFNTTAIVDRIARELPHSFNGIVWLSVESKYFTHEQSSRLDYLDNFAKTLAAKGFKVGIYSNLSAWTLTFGYLTACSDTLRTLPQWYYSNNGAENFNDFGYASFGKWRNPKMKEYIGQSYACGFSVMGQEYFE